MLIDMLIGTSKLYILAGNSFSHQKPKMAPWCSWLSHLLNS